MAIAWLRSFSPLVLAASVTLSATAFAAETADNFSEHYQSAVNFMVSGDREHAAGEFRAFLTTAFHRLANGEAGNGAFEAAFRDFEEALKFSPDDIAVKSDYARACLDADKPVQARALAESAVTSEPNADTTLLYGRALFHMGEFSRAVAELQRSYRLQPGFNTGYLLAKTYLLLRQEGDARTLFRQMASAFGDTARTHVFFGRAYSETDYRAEAIEEFHRAMNKEPRAPDVHYYLGVALLGHNESVRYAQAIPEFQAELERNPSDFRSHYMLGYIALKQRDFGEAEKELSAALRLRPEDFESLLKLAEVYLGTDRDRDAEGLLRSAISSQPQQATEQLSRAHYALARILERRGSRQEALKEFEAVAAIQRQLGPISTQTEDKHTAEAQERAIATGPEWVAKSAQLEQFKTHLAPALAQSYDSLGIIAAGDGHFVQAVTDFKTAASWDPTLQDLDRNLGRAAFLAGDFRQAIAALSKYLETHPQDPSARGTLGLSLFHLGEYEKVVDVLAPMQEAMQSNPELLNAYTVSLGKTGKK
ncbi:MAG: tetratricopeptide repeat protein [Acidobacteria bacterium]|nr:tetratricopeptide repeat protein [Acidobacteriota bacterium]